MELEQAKLLCESLMKEWGLGKNWKFQWIKRKTRYGCCNKLEYLIQLSKYFVLVNNESEVKNTILHEIAHAKCHKRGHNKYWRQWCIKLGARPLRTNEIAISPRNYTFAEEEGKTIIK